ncbi:MAG TPA: hypothetical protein VEM40_03220 [Nitrospirota bacterium]|nr:hypothetical protein [Nitrospirota bacterium]
MKIVVAIWTTLVLFMVSLPQGILAQGEGGNPSFTVTEAKTTKEKVVAIDYQARKVTLKDEEESVRTVQVGEEVANLERVRIGDEVTVMIHQTISVEVQPGPGDTMNIGTESQTSAVPGAKPSGTRSIEGKLKTRVESINYDTRMITFKNRKGFLTTYKVGPQVKRFDEIRKGDMLVVDYSQTLTLSVK